MTTPKRYLGMLLSFPLAFMAGVGLPAAAAHASGDGRVYRAEAATPLKPRIVSGGVIGIQGAPWQVLVSTTGGELCGGSILTSTTVVTAAHCVVDGATHADLAPAVLFVDAGASRFDFGTIGFPPVPQPGDAPQTRGVTVNRVHPGYTRPLGGGSTIADFVDDVAVLTLNAPLTFGPAVQPIAPTARDVASPVGAAGQVTGYGRQSEAAAPNGQLFALGETVQDGSLYTDALNALFVTGISPSGSFCSGDSGGPLQLGGTLLGVVSNDPGCRGTLQNNYVNVSAGEVRDFLAGDDTPPLAPRGGQNVTLMARADRAPRHDDTLTCSAGTWSNGPAFTYTFVDRRNGRVLQSGPSASYKVTGIGDAGATISCQATAANDGGVGRTPPTIPAPGVTPKDELSLSVKASGKAKVRRGKRITFTLTLRNRGGRTLTGVRQCARLSSRYTVVARGHGRVKHGRICWSQSSLSHVLGSSAVRPAALQVGGRLRTHFRVRIHAGARLGRFVQRARATSSQHVSDSAHRSLRIVR